MAQVSWFEDTLVHQKSVRCDVTDSWYSCDFKASERHGKGRVEFDDGSSYEVLLMHSHSKYNQ